MTFQEKTTWAYAAASAAVPTWYFWHVLSLVGHVPVAQIAYVRPMLTAIVVSIVLTIVGTIILAIVTAVGAQITGNGSINEIDRKDERDIHIGRRGELIGYYVASAGMVGVLALTMLRFDYFWIANGLYLSFVIAALVSSAAKLVAYRRGF